jgi:colicin import membrane protein
MNKKLVVALLFFMPAAAFAQTDRWEKKYIVTENDSIQIGEDAKYLKGAVSEENGEVEWNLHVDVPGKSADWIFDHMGQLMTDMTHEPDQMEDSRIAFVDEKDHQLAAQFHEWLVFKSSVLSIDRTEFFYTMIVNCNDESADVKICRIHYVYEKERNSGQRMKAEEWITDKYGLNKSQTKLARVSGKFRKKTIDRKDSIFSNIKSTLLLE